MITSVIEHVVPDEASLCIPVEKKRLQNFFFFSSSRSLCREAAPCVIRNPNEMEIRAKLCSQWSAHFRKAKKKKKKKNTSLISAFRRLLNENDPHLKEPLWSSRLSPLSPSALRGTCVLRRGREASVCLRCAKAAYSSRISIQLQQKGYAELPLIGRAAREGF